MTDVLRVSPEEARDKISSGPALFVCAYEDEEKFKRNHLEGAISLTEFKSKISTIARDREIIFYCA